jgi:hypothetical protein
VIFAAPASGGSVRTAVIRAVEMLRDARTTLSVKPHCRDGPTGERHLWVAPALQVFSGDIRGFVVSTVVCPACLCFGIASTGPDEFRKRGSNRLIDLKGPLPFPECPCSWLT